MMNIFAKQASAAVIMALTLSPIAALSVQAADDTAKDNVGITTDSHNDANGGVLANNTDATVNGSAGVVASTPMNSAGSNAAVGVNTSVGSSNGAAGVQAK